jgi:hypothetical protein
MIYFVVISVAIVAFNAGFMFGLFWAGVSAINRVDDARDFSGEWRG